MELFRNIAGIAAGVLSLLVFVPYVRAVLRGEAKPARSTWIIWSFVTLLLLTSYYEVGGGAANWISLADFLAAAAISILSIKYGLGGWSRLDKICFAGCGLAVLVWYATGSALIALCATVFIDALGATATIVKTYHHPEHESALAWGIAFCGNSINLFAIGIWDVTHILYPLYMVLMSGTILALTRRMVQKTNAR